MSGSTLVKQCVIHFETIKYDNLRVLRYCHFDKLDIIYDKCAILYNKKYILFNKFVNLFEDCDIAYDKYYTSYYE